MASRWIISRHPATIEWLTQTWGPFDHVVATLPLADIQPGDCLYGNISAHLIAAVNCRGGRYFHVSLNVPRRWRGRELSMPELALLRPQLQEIRAEIIGPRHLPGGRAGLRGRHLAD